MRSYLPTGGKKKVSIIPSGSKSRFRLIWHGEASDMLEALRNAAEADSRVDLRFMKIKHEKDLEQE